MIRVEIDRRNLEVLESTTVVKILPASQGKKNRPPCSATRKPSKSRKVRAES